MGDITLFSATYYSQFTIGGVPSGWNRQIESGSNPVYGASNFAEQGGPIDNLFQQNEIINPDYSALDATFLGTITHGGREFYFIQDQYGYLLATQEMNLAHSEFPPGIDPSDILNQNQQACFLAGTEISTVGGAIAIEDLKIGSMIARSDGSEVVVKWVGRQSVNALVAGPRAYPVCIRAGALGKNLPHSDLTVTADHGMVIDGYVINASALVNGDTIDFLPLDELENNFTVYHIETEDHDVILANGTAAETFVDAVTRSHFDNYQEYLDLYDVEQIIPEMDRPRISTPRLLPEVLKTRLGIVDQRSDFGDLNLLRVADRA